MRKVVSDIFHAAGADIELQMNKKWGKLLSLQPFKQQYLNRKGHGCDMDFLKLCCTRHQSVFQWSRCDSISLKRSNFAPQKQEQVLVVFNLKVSTQLEKIKLSFFNKYQPLLKHHFSLVFAIGISRRQYRVYFRYWECATRIGRGDFQ